jgi:hypothetical protein
MASAEADALSSRAASCLASRRTRAESPKEKLPYQARRHATAVAAIILSGQPKIDKPLNKAWNRALRHYGINVGEPEEMGLNCQANRPKCSDDIQFGSHYDGFLVN